MRRVQSSSPSTDANKKCNPVELYFDPDGKEGVADCLVKEGWYIARGHGHPSSSVVGAALTKTSDSGLDTTEEELEDWNDSSNGDSPSLHSQPRRRQCRNLMSMVDAALKLLEAESA